MSYDEFYKRGGFCYDQPLGRGILGNTSLRETFHVLSASTKNGIVTCLDVGCGDGFWTQLIEEMGYSVFGIDKSRVGIEIAKRRCPRGKFKAADLMKAKYGKQKFDVVFVRGFTLYNRPISKDMESVTKKILDLTRYMVCFSIHTKKPYGQWDPKHSSYYHDPEKMQGHFFNFLEKYDVSSGGVFLKRREPILIEILK